MSWSLAQSGTSGIGWQSDPLRIGMIPANSIQSTNTRLQQAALWNPFQSGAPSALDLPGYLPDIFSMGYPLDIPLHQRVRLNMKRKRHLCECGESFNTIEGLHGHITTSHPFRKVEDASLLLLLGDKNECIDAPLRKQLCIRTM